MIFDGETFYIEESRLAEALELTQAIFDEMVNILASSPNKAIRECVHFIVLGRIHSQPVRNFSREGAIAIARYLESCDRINSIALKKVFDLIEEYRISRIDRSVRQAIYENSSSLNISRKLYWLSQEDVLNIFKINSQQLNVAFRNIQTSENPMKDRQDFEDRETVRYFSLSGLAKFSRELSLILRRAEEREYSQRVRKVAPPVLEFLALVPSPSQKAIEKAMRYAKDRDGCCQITGVEPSKYNNTKLVGHHLFDKNTYRFLSHDPDNIIAISEPIHDDFHRCNGGTDKSCTVDDFIKYVEWKYPQKHQAILMLYNRREILWLKLSQLQRALPAGPERVAETMRQLSLFDDLDDRSDFS